MMSDLEASSSDVWFNSEGPDNDVVLSTRIRFARNLAEFPFPLCFRNDDAIRVRSLVFDAFAHCSNPDNYQAVFTSKLEPIGKKILFERGIMKASTPIAESSGIVIRTDGVLSCIVNDIDHIRLSAFKAGLVGLEIFDIAKNVDNELQESLQFAANVENGYLTSNICDCGSGMKISCRVHLPALTFSDKIKDILIQFSKYGIEIKDCFGVSLEKSSSVGSFYQVSTKVSGNGSEIEQVANLIGAVKFLAETERKISSKIFSFRKSEVTDKIYKAYATSKFSLLLSLKEAIEMISSIKWGKNLEIIKGISDSELCALLYRIQSGHIRFFMQSRKFDFSEDISKNASLKESHLRALILQEAFSKLSF